MRVFAGESADQAWRGAAAALASRENTIDVSSRGGDTTELIHCALRIADPRQRWVVSREPALNVAFALAEVIWILAGRNDVAFLSHWNSQYPKYVGGSRRAHGAYGERLRVRFGLDQLMRAYKTLRHNPGSRQVVLQMWSTPDDLPSSRGRPRSGDIPCNVMSLVRLNEQRLEWMQICRSNDIYLGVPHNLVQFTYLQEFLAGWLGVEIGGYTHVINSLHLYRAHESRFGAAGRAIRLPAPGDSRLSLKVYTRALREAELHASAMVRSTRRRPKPLEEWPKQLPSPFSDMLYVLAAEDARRRGWEQEAHRFAESCQCPVLQLLWSRWLARLTADTGS